MISNENGGGVQYIKTKKESPVFCLGQKDEKGNYPIEGHTLSGWMLGIEAFVDENSEGVKTPKARIKILMEDGQVYIWTPGFSIMFKSLLNSLHTPGRLGYVSLYMQDKEYVTQKGKSKKRRSIALRCDGELVGWYYPINDEFAKDRKFEGREVVPPIEYVPHPDPTKPMISNPRAQDLWWFPKVAALGKKCISEAEARAELKQKMESGKIPQMNATYGEDRKAMGIEAAEAAKIKEAQEWDGGDDTPPVSAYSGIPDSGEDDLPF